MNPPSSLKNVAVLISGSIVGQAIVMLALPVITRLYTPEDFGNYAAFTSLIMLIGIVAAMQFEQAIPLPRSEGGAVAVVHLASFIALATCSVSALLIVVGNHFLDQIYNTSLGWLWALAPLASLMMAFLLILNMLANRHELYGAIAVSRAGRAVALVLTQITIVLTVGAGSVGLILGELVGGFAALVLHIFALSWFDKNRVLASRVQWLRFKPRASFAAASRYVDFARIRTPHVLINAMQDWAVVLLVGILFNAQTLGIYFLMYRVVMFPASLLSAAVGRVYYKKSLDRLAKEGRFGSLARRVVAMQAIIGLGICLVLVGGGEQLFAFVFGEEWGPAGNYAKLFSPYVAAHLILSSLAYTSIVADRQRMAFVLSVVQNLIFLTSFYIGSHFFGGIDAGLMAVSATLTLYILGVIVWNLHIADNPGSYQHRVLLNNKPKREQL